MSIEYTSTEQKVSSTLPSLDITRQEPKLDSSLSSSTTTQHAQNKRDQGLKNVVVGSISGMTGKIVEYPFDTVKVRLQSQPIPFKGPLDCFRQTYRNEGFLGFYKGLSAPMLGAMIENAVIFASYNQIQMMIREYKTPKHEHHLIYEMDLEKSPLELRELFFAGAIAGTLASFLLTPIELIKCKLQNLISAALKTKTLAQTTNPPKFTGPISVIRHTLEEKGISGFFRGTLATMLRETIGCGFWFGTYEYVSQFFIRHKQSKLSGPIHNDVVITKSDLNPLHLMTAGALAGIGYNVSSFPADSIKSVMQTEEEMNKIKRTFFQVGKDIYKEHGIPGFYRGCGMTALRAAPSNAIIFMTYVR
ncbi:12376_t:CDS:2 [Ambispora gerdemannii]|uniref:12376_t:CDS:1 n=1 Tax=Ambispora gerdemannii TaxID=144530 RepID=A0A9N8UYK3_9GLOM|nr:12376_t:CDS:2 [Ambispora gerdemannii]